MKREYVASPSSLCGAERFTLTEGKGKGVDMVRLYNGKLDLTVALDRCMDIFRLFYRGTPVGYISKNGMVSPRLAETRQFPFSSSFGAGFLYTCGLDNIGGAREENGRTLCQHGSISYRPAENVRVETEEKGGEYYLHLKGSMVFTSLFEGKLELRRTITLREGGDELELHDEVVNDGFTEDGFLLMYHCNLGYPLLDENAELTLDGTVCRVNSEKGDTSRCLRFEKPTPARPEEVFLHKVNAGKGVKARVCGGGLALSMEFDPEKLPYMIEWKSMACGDYVLGLEPATTPVPTLNKRMLKAGESADYTVIWRFSEP